MNHRTGTQFIHPSGFVYPSKKMMEEYWRRSMEAHKKTFGSNSLTASSEGWGGHK